RQEHGFGYRLRTALGFELATGNGEEKPFRYDRSGLRQFEKPFKTHGNRTGVQKKRRSLFRVARESHQARQSIAWHGNDLGLPPRRAGDRASHFRIHRSRPYP